MTSNITLTQKARRSTTRRVDALRLISILSGLCGAFLILFTAGSSDAGLLNVGEIVSRVLFGGVLLLFWRALSFFASELERSR